MTFLSTRLARGERGSLAPSVAAIIVVLFLLGGLIIDGARALHGRSRATAYAEEGARIAGQGVMFDRGRLELDAQAMRANAVDYCTRIRAADDGVGDCGVEPVDGEIIFTVELTVEKGILGMVTPDPTMTFVGTGRAIAEIGITEARGSADQPRAIESQLIPGDEVDPKITQAPGGRCPPVETWEAAPPGTSPDPFVYWDQVAYTLEKPASCTIPPVCPVDNRELAVPHAYRTNGQIPTEEELRADPRWQDFLSRCPVAEELLYTIKPMPSCELGEKPGEPPTCKPLPPCEPDEKPGSPAQCEPLPPCKDDEKPGSPPKCDPLPPCPPGKEPGDPPTCDPDGPGQQQRRDPS